MSENAIAKMMAAGGAIAPVSGGNATAPYVQFASNRANNWTQLLLKIPGLNEGDAVLIRADPFPPMKLSPFNFILFGCDQFWCKRNQADFSLLESFKQEVADSQEEVQAAMIVVTGDGKFVPATCAFRTTKVNAVKAAVRAFQFSTTPDWPNLSEAHKATLAIEIPWARFITTVSLAPKVARSGFKYVAANGTTTPMPSNVWGALVEWLKDDANKNAMADVMGAYNRRLDEYKEKLKS